jgi:methionyl-tRNA formyltransferase
MRRAVLSLQGVPEDFFQLASSRGIPIWEVRSFSHPETVSTLASYQPDFICVACFSRRIPRVLLEIPTRGCLNVHPSLLPANRGPVPLFWILREGRDVAGVTIHEIEETMDSGAILAQEVVPVPDGGSYEQLEARCALLGGALLARTVWDVYAGHAIRQSQDESKSSYQTFPEASDLVIEPSSWQARHLYNFIRGIRNWDFPLVLSIAGEQWIVRDAVAFGGEESPPPLESDRAVQWAYLHLVECQAGWVRVLLHPHNGLDQE